ncbi:hypothetical protein PPL_01301 [Heterostelium album PN500]|uniref:Ankyrin repeat protein n=1 Tax=Heterostelium pallidum (strain ATCC 26659 / Pp 5 / PN500) TaxID=670386 RepID=D3AYN7_HETP5|nr:hypothetical protein PPL_01301 [Heterostelium album PN500]EFA86064.1 hypothetical protein PPL_01301 [Heterostelium album PN500]|eukprot:XP_020438170.1 hypothetical protein PPL_01301 [Heterostelium album PN500]
MNNSLFKSVFNNKVLNKLIFNKVNFILSRLTQSNQKLYKWQEIIEDPYILASHGYFNEIKACLSNRIKHVRLNYIRLFERVIRGGNLEIFKYILEYFRIDRRLKIGLGDAMLKTLLITASRIGRLEIIQYLFERFANYKWDFVRAINDVPQSNDLDLLKMLVDKLEASDPNEFDDRFDDRSLREAFNNAAFAGNIEIFKWLLNYRPKDFQGSMVFGYAIAGNQLEFLRYLFENHKDHYENGSNYLLSAMECEDTFEIFELLMQHTEFHMNQSYYPAYFGNLKVLKYLHSKSLLKCTHYEMDKAAIFGYMDMLKWLDENFKAGCSTAAMDEAAQRNQLEAVKWLHENRTEGCTKEAMDGALKSGHLEMAKWLLKNRTEGHSFSITSDIALTGNRQVLEWFIENTNHKPLEKDPTILRKVVAKGHLEIVKYLHERNGEDNIFYFTSEIMNIAASQGHMHLIQWLHHNRTEGCTEDILALNENIYKEDYTTMVQWILENKSQVDIHSIRTEDYISHLIQLNQFELLEWWLNKLELSKDQLIETKRQLYSKYPLSFDSLDLLDQYINK